MGKLEEQGRVEDPRRWGARVGEVTCPGDLREMGNEEGLEGGQTQQEALGESRKRSADSCPQQWRGTLVDAWLGKALGGGGGREGLGHFVRVG